jgi:exopolyphosphatase/guanosine-5'-triphosphate,3'-diphosphate pyrophosphatase
VPRPQAGPRPNNRPARADRPVAVVDIGSNSVRLVVFDGLRRMPLALYNEKVTCELGRGIEEDGHLRPDSVARAITSLERFVAIARHIGADTPLLLATAAARDATDGSDFATEVRRRLRVDMRILSGAEEARLSALGTVSGNPSATGVVGDLGGGSLEVVALDQGALGAQATLPVGPLRLMALGSNAAAASVRDAVNARLAEVPWLAAMKGADFFAVGGAWRALARLHMAQEDYPLRVIHNYAISGSEAAALCDVVARMSRQSLKRVAEVSRNRLAALPWAAFVLRRVLATLQPRRVVFSANGLREGVVYDMLGAAERRRDPLIAACENLMRDRERGRPHGAALARFIAPVFERRDERSATLRRAACLLSDIGWREHPEYRAEAALESALRLPFGCLDHAERGWLALALHARYGGPAEVSETRLARRLVSSDGASAARAVGLALRLGYSLSGSVASLLAHARLERNGGTLKLATGARLKPFVGELVERRLGAVADALGLKPAIDQG